MWISYLCLKENSSEDFAMLIRHFKNSDCIIGKKNEKIYELLNANNSDVESHSVAYLILPLGQSTDAHYHPDMEETYFVLAGEGEILLEENIYKIHSGDLIHIPKNTVHQLKADLQNDLEVLTLSIPSWTPESTVVVSDH